MKKSILLGVGENSLELLYEAYLELTKNRDIEIVCICSDSEKLFNQMISHFRIKPIIEIFNINYDQIIICTNNITTDDIAEYMRQQLHLTPEQCYSYLLPRIGRHTSIDPALIKNRDDILIQLENHPNLNDLEKYFYQHKHRTLTKWLHYFEIYNRHFEKYREKNPTVMEIGIFKGGSLQMWKNYFGKGVQIIGIDIDPETKNFEEDGICIEIGSQEDREFLNYLKKKYPKIDILIDDGGHTMDQQIITFEEMFPHISYGGCYLCEDLHTSYWEKYGGGYQKQGTYIEYSKNFIDYIHGWHSECEELYANKYTRSMHSLHYYDSVLVIEKEHIGYPVSLTLENK